MVADQHLCSRSATYYISVTRSCSNGRVRRRQKSAAGVDRGGGEAVSDRLRPAFDEWEVSFVLHARSCQCGEGAFRGRELGRIDLALEDRVPAAEVGPGGGFGEGRVQRVPGDVLHPGGEDPYGFAAQLPFQTRGEFPGGGERAADVDRRSHDDRVVIQRRHRIDITSDRKSTRLNSSHVAISSAVFYSQKK